jgi:rubrerythrin
MTTEDEISAALSKRLQQMEFEKKIDTVCKDNGCIKNDIKELHKKLDNKTNCPKCGLKVLTLGDSFCPSCGQEIEGWDELPGFITYRKRKGK